MTVSNIIEILSVFALTNIIEIASILILMLCALPGTQSLWGWLGKGINEDVNIVGVITVEKKTAPVKQLGFFAELSKLAAAMF
ncbi:MAG: hypothetical protein ABI723_10190 [Bacteroidia bacterium]